jgi:hypothetical protein
MNSDEPPKPQAVAAQLPGRDTVNTLQVSNLLNAINCYASFLTSAREPVDSNIPKSGYADGGAILAAEQTFIALSNRMQVMVADEARWSLAAQTDLEASLLSVHQAQKDYLRFQQAAITLSKAPHARFHPTLAKLEDGRWAAVFGDPTSAQSIIGLGHCPEEALADWDEIFDGRHQAIYEQKRKAAMDNGRSGIPYVPSKLNENPGFGRRIKANNRLSGAETRPFAPEPKPARKTRPRRK